MHIQNRRENVSSIHYDFIRPKVNFEVEANTFAIPKPEYAFTNDFCIGQDAGYILKKRAMIVDLWNLVPDTAMEKSSALDGELFFDLPVIYNNSMDGHPSFDKQIPIQ